MGFLFGWYRDMSLAGKLLLTICVGFLILWASILFLMRQMSTRIIDAQAHVVAGTVNNLIRATRKVYTANVVASATQVGAKTSASPAEPGEIPLPATFVHMIGEEVEKGTDLANYSLISGWNLNPGKGLKDDFEKEAWEHLTKQQDELKRSSKNNDEYLTRLREYAWQPFSRIETQGGVATLRYAQADPAAAEACVNCHNLREEGEAIRALRKQQGQTAIKRFQLNEIMGLLEVTVPIEKAGIIARAQSNQGLTVFTIVMVLIGVLLFVTVRRPAAQIRELATVTAKLATGDLRQQPIRVTSNDEVGQLGKAYNEMLSNLQSLVNEMASGSAEMAAAATQIYAASQEHEATAQHQAGGVEEVTRSVLSLLEAATHISESAGGVLTNAERTGATSESTAKKIAELGILTNRMEEILEVIREIADRSDLLALNASLEATRAGEAGRGFSLVAAELRRLAERVTASVQNVKTLVADVRAAGSSTVLVTEEGRKLAQNTTESARRISLVAQQQRTATDQVTLRMRNMSELLTQSLAAMRQNRSAAENLKSQAERMNETVGKFKLEHRRPQQEGPRGVG